VWSATTAETDLGMPASHTCAAGEVVEQSHAASLLAVLLKHGGCIPGDKTFLETLRDTDSASPQRRAVSQYRKPGTCTVPASL
jgi:hypothetical protein